MRLTIAVACTVMLGCSSATDPLPAPSTDGGVTDAAPSADATEPDAGACLAAGGDCRGKANDCCNGTTCVFDAADPSKAVCATTCLRGDQCNSGCCTVLIEGTSAVCAPAKYCGGSCSAPGAQCQTVDCCANAICVNSTVTGVSCAARCANHEQCVSGCCAPLSNTGELVCSPVTFCR